MLVPHCRRRRIYQDSMLPLFPFLLLWPLFSALFTYQVPFKITTERVAQQVLNMDLAQNRI